MGGAGKCDAVGDDVWAILLDRLDMRGLHLGSAAAIDELEACDGTAAIIGVQNDAAEYAITHDPGTIKADPLTLDIHFEARMFLRQNAFEMSICQHVGAGQQRRFVRNAQVKDSVEIFE